jgi:hypothetical protein
VVKSTVSFHDKVACMQRDQWRSEDVGYDKRRILLNAWQHSSILKRKRQAVDTYSREVRLMQVHAATVPFESHRVAVSKSAADIS